MAIPMVIAQENCSGCLSCALACSFFNTPERVFNPARAYVRIERREGQNRFVVSYLDECLECGVCVERCNYGVLADGNSV